jgi:hypothetical protein
MSFFDSGEKEFNCVDKCEVHGVPTRSDEFTAVISPEKCAVHFHFSTFVKVCRILMQNRTTISINRILASYVIRVSIDEM